MGADTCQWPEDARPQDAAEADSLCSDPDSEQLDTRKTVRVGVQAGQGHNADNVVTSANAVGIAFVLGVVIVVVAIVYHAWFSAPPVKAEVVPLPW